MDPLNSIGMGMAAIVAAWVGYFIGNIAPFFGRAKKYQLERKATGKKLFDLQKIRESTEPPPSSGDSSFLKRTGKKVVDWLLEREDGEEKLDVAEGTFRESTFGEEPSAFPAPVKPSTQPPPSEAQPKFYVPETLPIPEDAVVLWHDRRNKKLFSRVGKDIFDIDGHLTKHQHASLSMLLVDLQFKVGLSAGLKAALSESAEQVYSEKEKRDKLVTKGADASVGQTFNPVKTFLNYVKADVPKLEDKQESIPSQINAILQGMIKDSPLRERGISVADWPSRGVVFIVGLEIHDSIDEIPEPDIKEVIKEAVRTWEQTHLEE